jgi:hypothetical protein
MTDAPPPRLPPRWLGLLLRAPLLLAPIMMTWAGFRVVQAGSMIVGMGLIVVSAITAVLVFRRWRESRSLLEIDPTNGDVSPAYLDYIVWTFLGLPFVLIALLVLSLITEKATGT